MAQFEMNQNFFFFLNLTNDLLNKQREFILLNKSWGNGRNIITRVENNALEIKKKEVFFLKIKFKEI